MSARRSLEIPPPPVDVVRMLSRNGAPPAVVDPDSVERDNTRIQLPNDERPVLPEPAPVENDIASVRKSGRPRGTKLLLTGAIDRDIFAFVDDRWTSLKTGDGRRRYRDRGEYITAVFRAVRDNEALVMELVDRSTKPKSPAPR